MSELLNPYDFSIVLSLESSVLEFDSHLTGFINRLEKKEEGS